MMVKNTQKAPARVEKTAHPAEMINGARGANGETETVTARKYTIETIEKVKKRLRGRKRRLRLQGTQRRAQRPGAIAVVSLQGENEASLEDVVVDGDPTPAHATIGTIARDTPHRSSSRVKGHPTEVKDVSIVIES